MVDTKGDHGLVFKPKSDKEIHEGFFGKGPVKMFESVKKGKR